MEDRGGSTQLGWARYSGQEKLIELLEPLTRRRSPPPVPEPKTGLAGSRVGDLAEEQRQGGRGVEDREQERPVDDHRDRRGQPERG